MADTALGVVMETVLNRFETQNKILSLKQIRYYGREETSFSINPIKFHFTRRVHREDIAFNHSALSHVMVTELNRYVSFFATEDIEFFLGVLEPSLSVSYPKKFGYFEKNNKKIAKEVEMIQALLSVAQSKQLIRQLRIRIWLKKHGYYDLGAQMAADPALLVVMETLLNCVVPLAAEEIKINLAWGVKKELKRLAKVLEMIQALLSDAQSKQLIRQQLIRIWLKKLLGSYDLSAKIVLDKIFPRKVKCNPVADRLRQKLECRKRDKSFHYNETTSVTGPERRNCVKMDEWPEEETYPTCVDPARKIFEQFSDFLCHYPRHYPPHLQNSIQTTMLQELRFYAMFIWGLDIWQVSENDGDLRSAMTTVEREFRLMVEEFFGGEMKYLARQINYLTKRIKPFKQQAKEICVLLLGGEFKCKPCQDLELFLEYARETASFINFVLENLEALSTKFPLIPPAKEQIDFITGKLKVFGNFANPVSHSITRVKHLGELTSQTRTWAIHLSCLACLYWIDHELDETLASTTGTMLSDLMHKTTSCTPGVVASYFEGTLIPQLLASYIDFLLEDLVIPPMKDDIELLREGLIFLLSFIMDPPEEDSEDRELILGQTYSLINELPSLISSIHCNEMKDRISVTKLSGFLQKIAGVEVEVRKLYAITPHSSQFSSPRTNAIGFLDSLLQQLKKMLEGEVNFTARVKQGIETVWEELAWLKHFMQNIRALQNEQEELKDLWNRIVNLVYYAAYVTSLCSSTSFSIWYRIISLPSVLEEIKLIKNEVKDIKDPQMCKKKMQSVEMESRNTLLPQAATSKGEGAFIGFREDVRSIIDHLVRGSEHRTIICISGMPGQGKTTLAKRIYNDPAIQYHFHKTLWCYVSKECKIRDLMIDILQDVSKADVEEIQDLAERLRKSLKGKRYLIVMDDIWDVEVWRQVQGSFPDDRIGSRILFTSRNQDLRAQTELNFISYPLRSFSEKESCDLMKVKLLDCKGLGPKFLEIGKQIAIYCKGLPLAVVLAASVLGNTEQKLDLWKQVAENLKSYLASEGGMHIIELSYKYLPDHLKPCFLYFGAFPRGKIMLAKRLKLLWIAEGFIKDNEMQMRRLEDLAEEYLDYLVSRSLVVVTERSSMGGIKRCNVHDLLYDLCLEKIVEENFLHWVDKNTVSNKSRVSPQQNGHHRLCVGASDPVIKAMPSCRRKELPTSQVHSLLWLDNYSSDELLFRFLKSFRVLTVLDLEEVTWEFHVFPEVILCNIHLKYLALWGPRIKRIPPSIAHLWNLETLILGRPLYNADYVVLPDSMWRMKSLRHVNIDKCRLTLEDFEGNESYAAAHNIETLCGLMLGDDPHTVGFLRRLARLRKLKCYCEEPVLHPAWFSIFGSLQNLEELTVRRDLRLSASHLETCNFPKMNLRKLRLYGLRLSSWSAMSTIGKQLPNLEVLKLLWNACEGRIWDLEDGEFSNLRYLRLRGLDNLRQINVAGCNNPFPCLEELIVEYCPRLEEIPSEIGDICILNTIQMRHVSYQASESVKQILEQQRDMGNHSLKVFVSGEDNHEDDDDDDDEEDRNFVKDRRRRRRRRRRQRRSRT